MMIHMFCVKAVETMNDTREYQFALFAPDELTGISSAASVTVPINSSTRFEVGKQYVLTLDEAT